MPKVCEDGSLQDCVSNLFSTLQPPHVKRPPGRSRQRLPVDKLEVVRDLQLGGLLNLNCKEIRHNICLWLIDHFNVGFRRIDISSDKSYDLTAADVGLVFGLPTSGQILQIALTLFEQSIRWLRVLDDLNNGTMFGYMVASSSSRYCPAFTLITLSLLHCSHHYHQVTNPHLFISIVQLHYVIKFKIPSVHVPLTVPLLSTWLDDLIKERLAAEISQLELLEQYYAAERAINQYQKGIQHQLGIMRGVMHTLDGQNNEVDLRQPLVTQAMQPMNFAARTAFRLWRR
ncbi:hypothetical protein CK203_117646 [Vitis vinifera]|uniref:Uncharacterized protein n=1 Tax=Vitis vinifera TaxID=29760 RepID=A0A438C8A7_VITVI|nr:hypothetical protein CK203_117646 [Vitis vinifera]